MVKNSKANSILDFVHVVLGNMLHSAGTEGKNNIHTTDILQFILDATRVVCSTHHIFLSLSPGAAVLRQNMLFDLPYLAE